MLLEALKRRPECESIKPKSESRWQSREEVEDCSHFSPEQLSTWQSWGLVFMALQGSGAHNVGAQRATSSMSDKQKLRSYRYSTGETFLRAERSTGWAGGDGNITAEK